MEYKPLQFLENTYPNPNNYVPTGVEKTTLKGLYPEKNKIDFNLPSITDLKYVDGTEFKFVLAIFKDYKDTKPVYYTSEQYYNTIQNSLLEGNPYFSQASFNPKNIISYVIETPLKVYSPLHDEEIKPFVNMRQNIFINSGSVVDYDNLVTYIDWVVSQVSPLDDDNFGVLKPETIAGWDVLNGNYATGEFSPQISASYGVGASLVSTITSAEIDNQSDLKFQQEKLKKLKEQIVNLETAIKTEIGYILKPFLFGYISEEVNVNGTLYKTSIELKTKSDKIQQLKVVLTSELNNLQKNIITTESSIADVTKNIVDSAAKAKDLLNNAAALAAKAGDLLGKIPKIPKIPDIPPIPKLPSLSEIGAGLIAALPALPKLPKLPKIKLPSFKFPALPKFKKKEPKQPKKFKNKAKAGLAGLKDAANSAQGAAAGAMSSAQGVIAGAQSAAGGVMNAAQGAAAGVQSAAQGAIANSQSILAGAQSTAMNTLGNINKGIITNVTNVGGGTLTTKTITSAILGKGETEASILADIAKAAEEAAAYIKK